ncbi:MAG TPA: hypothetical protein VFO40_01515 [Chthoniobacterales bacterium]|nr:hypothetical protein [Chthoniobacterales bacterium]
MPDPTTADSITYTPLEANNPDSDSDKRLIEAYNTFRNSGGQNSELSYEQLAQVLSAAKGGNGGILPKDAALHDPETYYQQVFKPGQAPHLLIDDVSDPNFWLKTPFMIGNAIVNFGKSVVVGGAEVAKDEIQNINPFISQADRDAAGARIVNSIYTGLKSNTVLQFQNLTRGAKDLIDESGIKLKSTFTTDPEEQEKLRRQQSEILRQAQVREEWTQKQVDGARNDVAGLLRMVGLNDKASQIMSDAAVPTQNELNFAQIVTDPTNLLSAGAGKATTMLKGGIRTVEFEKAASILTAAEKDVASLQLQRTTLESGIASATDDAVKNDLKSQLARLGPQEQAAAAAHATALTDVTALGNAVKKQMDDFAGASVTRKIAGAGFGAIGDFADSIAAGVEKFTGVPSRMAGRVLGPAADDAAKSAVSELLGKMWSGAVTGVTAVAGHAVAGIPGAALGLTSYPIVRALLNTETMRNIGRDFQTIGKQLSLGRQTLPFWKAVAENTSGLTSAIASKLDNQLVYAIPDTVRGGVAGAGISGAVGAVTSSGQTEPTMQAIATGGLFGMAGGGMGQIGRFNDPATLRRASIGDRSRFMATMDRKDRPLFNVLRPDEQLAVSIFATAHPDLRVSFFHDPKGANGSHVVTDRGSSVSINVAGDSIVQQILAHEIAHHIASHDLGQTVADHMLGNPVTGETGAFTHLDENGKPVLVVGADGKVSYMPDARFTKYQSEYNARKLRDVPGVLAEDNYGIAQEMFAELHAAHFSDPALVQKMVRGFVPSDLVSTNTLANWFGKMGMGYDAVTGNPTGVGNVRGLVDTVGRYYKERQFKAHPLESEDGMTRIPPDMWRADPSIIHRNLDGAGIVARNPKTGEVLRDASGLPVIKSAAEADRDFKAMTGTVVNFLKANPQHLGEAGDNVLKLVTDRNGREVYRGQVVPQEVFDAVTATNQHNPFQIQNWQKVDGMTRRNDGSMMLSVYNTAGKGGKYATLAMKEKALVPLYTEISPNTHQVNIQAYDPETMQANIAKMLRRRDGQRLWDGKIQPASEDVNTYLLNLAANRPGETGIGLEKKQVINSLFGIAVDANPYIETVAGKVPSVFKTFRLDRMNRVREVSGVQRPVGAATYEQVRAFQMPREEAAAAQPALEPGTRFAPRNKSAVQATDEVTPEAIPVTYRTTSSGKKKPNTQGYEIADAPLVADKQPPEKFAKDAPNDFTHIDFIGPLDQKRLTHLDSASATTQYADKIVAEFAKWKDNPDVMAAKTWYRDVRGYLEKSFGKDAELFAHLLAATSPQQGVVQNWHDALEAYHRYKLGAYDEAIAQFKKTGKITEDMKPTKANGAKFGLNSDEVLKVFAGTWLESAKGPKTPNFFDNLFGRGTRATIDKWAGRTMRRLGFDGVAGAPERWRLTPKSEAGVSNLDFAFSQEAFDKAAAKLGMDSHELQAIMWYAEKHHWAEKGWAKGGAAAAKASYVPMLEEYSKAVQSGRKMTEEYAQSLAQPAGASP